MTVTLDFVNHKPVNIAPPGKFRVLGHKLFEVFEYPAGDYFSLEEANSQALDLNNGRRGLSDDEFYVVDDKGIQVTKVPVFKKKT